MIFMCKKSLLISILLFIHFCLTVFADDIIYVAENSDPPYLGTSENPFIRIQDAIDAAADGQTVLVRDGVYRRIGNRNIDFKGKAITIKSENGPENCIIDVTPTQNDDPVYNRGFIFQNAEGRDSILHGFTIKKVRLSNTNISFGGGILCYSSPTIKNNIITDNSNLDTQTKGGGMFLSGSGCSPLIINNIIHDNSASEGGGIYCENDASPEMIGNIISSNGADDGGGIKIQQAVVLMAGNIIKNNFAYDDTDWVYNGAGITCIDSTLNLINNTIAENATENGNPPSRHSIFFQNSESTILNTIIFNTEHTFIRLNESIVDISYSNIHNTDEYTPDMQDNFIVNNSTLNWLDGNIGKKPLFAGPGDYHLSDYSPCIGAGFPDDDMPIEDLDGKQRPYPAGSMPDMGAYENDLPESLPYIYVSTAGDDVNGDGRPENPYNTIQKGIDEATDGKIVVVQDGTYKGKGNWDIDFKGKAITVKSENGPENCIIDVFPEEDASPYTDYHRGFIFQNGEDRHSVLDGFTIKGAWLIKLGMHTGGGIYCTSSPTIKNNVITDNISSGTLTRGGGIFLSGSGCSPLIINNFIHDNSANTGGGIHCRYGASPEIIGNVISNNGADTGGGLYIEDASVFMANNLIINNYLPVWIYADFFPGAAITCHHSSLTLINNTIAGNSIGYTSPDDTYIISLMGSESTIINTIIRNSGISEIGAVEWNSRGSVVDISYSNIQNMQESVVGSGTVNWLDGNIDANPAFVDPDNGDYHLSNNSPCIGSGLYLTEADSIYMPLEDLDGNPRPNPPGTDPDMGAYESPLALQNVNIPLIIQSFSPVDLIVTDPCMKTIDLNNSEIPRAVYKQTQAGAVDSIFIPDAIMGNYSIKVIPEPGADPNDTYKLEVTRGNESVILAQDAKIQDIPEEPYVYFNSIHSLNRGWNLISLPLMPSDTSPDVVLDSIDGKYRSIWAYDPVAGWTIHFPEGLSNMTEIIPGRGYYIDMAEPGMLKMDGTSLENTNIFLKGNEWNMVGYSSTEAKSAAECMNSVVDEIDSVWKFNINAGWLIYIPYSPEWVNSLTCMGPGYGYWIWAKEDCEWDLNAPTAMAAPSLAMREHHFSKDIPDIPQRIWGRVQVDGEDIADKDAVVIVKVNDEIKSVCNLYDGFYSVNVPVDKEFELFVYIEDYTIKAAAPPTVDFGQVTRFDLSITFPPKKSAAYQNYPNPFNPETWIPYHLSEDAHVEIKIYSSTGQLVRTLNLGQKTVGYYVAKDKAAYWDGKNEVGEKVASGVYFYSIKAGDLSAIRKTVLAK
ncbi:T9SS type A sorting domain-containing protein [Candidatus Poribacteria bacterium]|nr:T9SS type A sorting domain-containing protein [Candidatus Poribacteria bacterium]